MGENHPNWTGGRCIDKDGYVLIYMPKHPHANYKGQVREHRVVMEKQIGRLMTRAEVIHHVNGDTSDNRPCNLVLFASNAEHKRHERSERKTNHAGQFTRKEA